MLRRERKSRRGWHAARCAPASPAIPGKGMTNYWRGVSFACFALVSLVAGAQTAMLPRAAAVPGGVVTLEIPGAADEAPVASFNGAPVMVLKQPKGWVAIVGVNLDTPPGELALDVQQPGADPRRMTF